MIELFFPAIKLKFVKAYLLYHIFMYLLKDKNITIHFIFTMKTVNSGQNVDQRPDHAQQTVAAIPHPV